METQAARLGLSLIEFPIAVGLGFAAFFGIFAAGCWFTHCVDWGGMGWMLLGMIVGPVVGIAYWITMMRIGPRFRRRLIWDGVALVVGLSAYFVPLVLSGMRHAS